jgi:lipoic acid synthetase
MQELKLDSDRVRLPRWMKAKFPNGENYARIKNLIHNNNLNTICSSGNCPNKGECWGAGTATFMILGDKCTRACSFCNVEYLKPDVVDWEEPQRLAETIKLLNLKHAVITSVARDDLVDGGAQFWATTIRMVKELNPDTTMEVLIPDFNRNFDVYDLIINEKPEVISHNVETVFRLTPSIRNMARYHRSLEVLKYISRSGITTKSGFMLGLGETEREVFTTMDDVLHAGVKVLTIGQYLAPSDKHAVVVEYVRPEVFEKYRIIALDKGFKAVESSPLVRSSYHAERHVNV